MSSYKLHPLHLALLVALAPSAAHAQSASAPTPPPVATLDTVTISASGLNLDADSMSTPVLVLEGDALIRSRQATLGDTLAGQPGIHADTFGGGASRPVIRGQTAPRVSVLSDGSPLLDASGISPDHAITTEPLLARQIEVLRGPATLLYGGGAIGGVVNVLDNRVPTRVPERGVEGSVEIQGGTAARERTGAFSLTAGSGEFVFHAEGLKRRSDDYRVPDWTDSRLNGSFNDTWTGSVGAAWVTPRGYLGLAFSSQNSTYGLPGHSHEYESCHPHGTHLHCGSHDHSANDHDHDHGHDHAEDAPYVKLRSHRVDLRGEYLEPFAGVDRVRLRAGFTDYKHDEIDDGTIATTFKNRGYDARLEVQHRPVAGWSGVIGTSLLHSDFSAEGLESFLPPSTTRNVALFALEEYRTGNWRFELGARHERQKIDPDSTRFQSSSHNGTSVSAGAVWDFAPSYALALSLARSQRLPSAQELYARGVHLATNTYELGSPDLQRETSHNIDLTLRKTAGASTFSAGVFHNRVKNYIYADTLDQFEDFRLIRYSQHDAQFTGAEGHVRYQLNPVLAATLFGDYVRGRFTNDGGNLPRIPSARVGVKLDANWQAWSGGVELYHVYRQSRLAAYETQTAGYNMLNANIAYKGRYGSADYQLYLRANNLLDKLAYNHASFISTVAPLRGRNVMVGMRMAF